MILKAMSTVIHFSKRLSVRPVAGTLPGIAVPAIRRGSRHPAMARAARSGLCSGQAGRLRLGRSRFRPRDARRALVVAGSSLVRDGRRAASSAAESTAAGRYRGLGRTRLPHQPWPRCIGWPCFPRGAAAAWPGQLMAALEERGLGARASRDFSGNACRLDRGAGLLRIARLSTTARSHSDELTGKSMARSIPVCAGD